MPSRKKKSEHHLIAMWDMLGLECVLDVNEYYTKKEQWEKEKIWSTLQDKKHNVPPPKLPLPYMLLRARTNSQRRYEIYEFNSMFSKAEVEEMFKESPQTIVDAIRNIGHKIYSDREIGQKAVIT